VQIDLVKQAEKMTAQDEQRFIALLEHASMGVVEVNQLGEIGKINPFALQLFGYTEVEILYKKIELLIPGRFHSRHSHHREDYIRHPRNRPMGAGMDLFAVKKDGTEFPVEVSLSSYTRNNEKYVIAFVSDITIRKEAELKVKKLNDELEGIVDQRTRELQTVIQQLERSKEELSRTLEKEKDLNDLKSKFVSMASHEFRTPLSTVLSSAYLLQKYTTTEDQSKREKHLQRIISSVNMLTDILNDFLSVGKIEEGKIHLRVTEFNIQECIASVIEEIQNNLRKKQKIQYSHKGAPEVELDMSLLKHIIMNLVSNASKFSPEASVIDVKSESVQDKLTLSVKDQGMGISPEDQQHLMERFFRGSNASTIQGTGLGLHIVAKYVELLNGTIDCKSELEKGTEFKLTFKIDNYEKDPAY
jgi:PAS domain S-box-containing protein